MKSKSVKSAQGQANSKKITLRKAIATGGLKKKK